MKVGEDPDRIRPPANAGDDRVRQPPFDLQNLHAGLATDHPLKLAHHQGERVRPGDRAQKIVRIGKARRPVPQRLVDRILQSPPTGRHRHYLGAHQLHAEDVQLLALDVVRAHVDAGLEAEQRPGHGGGDAMLPGAGFGDQAALAHTLCQQALGQHLVGLVRAAVEQILTLQVNARLARPKVAAACERRWPPGISSEQPVELGLEARIVPGRQERRAPGR
jgi:hypothetical protein